MPHSQISIILDEPAPELVAPARRAFEAEGFPVCVAGESIAIIDSTEYLHDEAAVLNAEELADARAALVEDGIFPQENWMDDDGQLRAAVKYGWALAHLSAADESTLETITWSVANGFVTTTPAEWSFLSREVGARAPQVSWIAPCTPSHFEPGIDYAGDLEVFESWLAQIDSPGSIGVMFPNAEEKLSLLLVIARRTDLRVAFGFSSVGWTEALRVTARTNPALFRDLLPIAQERFVFDKGPFALSTTEDDIRSLPSVSDSELAATFIDDFRGRQLLQVTAPFVLQEQSRKREILDAVLERRGEWEQSVVAAVQRQLSALRQA